MVNGLDRLLVPIRESYEREEWEPDEVDRPRPSGDRLSGGFNGAGRGFSDGGNR
jgi:hypothetical protein